MHDGPLTTITLKVESVDNNPPLLAISRYNYTVDEESSGQLGPFTITDGDSNNLDDRAIKYVNFILCNPPDKEKVNCQNSFLPVLKG